MKAILILNLDNIDDVKYCQIGGDGNIYLIRPNENRASIVGKIKNLKPMPKIKEPSVDNAKEYWFACGFNDCLED